MDCQATVIVAAPRAEVWKRVAAISAWPEWNPLCAAAECDDPVEVGDYVRLTLVHPRGRQFFTRPMITYMDTEKRLQWEARGPGLRAPVGIDLSDDEGGTRATMTASSHGGLSFTYRLVMRPKTQAKMYRTMLDGLVESFT